MILGKKGIVHKGQGFSEDELETLLGLFLFKLQDANGHDLTKMRWAGLFGLVKLSGRES